MKAQFFVREYTFWALLEPYLNFHGPVLHFSGVGNSILGFKTCFSNGLANTSPFPDSDSDSDSDSSWYNLRKTDFQPSLIVIPIFGDGTHALKEALPYTSYTSSDRPLDLNPSLCISTKSFKTKNNERGQITVPIFICELSLDPGDVAIFLLTISVVKYIYSEYSSSIFRIKLGTEVIIQKLGSVFSLNLFRMARRL